MDALRAILHVDMDAFYASIEQRDNPDLRGKPVVVGGGIRGVVAAASYESRKYGIRSAMPMTEARRRCSTLVRVKPRMALYQSVSRQIFRVFREFTPVVEGLSLDEAFLDVTASGRLFGTPRQIATAIKRRIREQTGLTASVGVAFNKLVAKIASDMDKPDGLVEITPENVQQKLDPLPVSVIPGIGRETLARLNDAGIASVADLRRADVHDLERLFGRFAGRMRQRASGIDDRQVVISRADKSISAERTFDSNLTRRIDMERELLRLAERTSARLRKAALAAGVVQVKIRRADFSTCSRQKRVHPPADGTDQIYAIARDLLARWLIDNPDAHIRLLGVATSGLGHVDQQDLFDAADTKAGAPVDRTVDEIRDRFGDSALGRARTLAGPERPG